MSALNVIGIVLLLSVLVIKSVMRVYIRRKLNDIDGLGPVHKQGTPGGGGIYL